MTWEWQVVYRETMEGRATGPLLVQTVWAETEEEASVLPEDLAFVRVVRGRPVVDWNKPALDRDEAAAAFSREHDFIRRHQAAGNLPPARNGATFMTLRQIQSFVEEGKAA